MAKQRTPKKSAARKAAKKPVKKAVKKLAKKPAKKATKKTTVKKGVKKPAKKATKKTTVKKGVKKPAKKAAPPPKEPPKPKILMRPEPRLRGSQVICPLSNLVVSPGTPKLAPSTLTRLAELLEEERARHLHQAEELAAEADELATEREQGDTQFDEESGEGDTVSVERERSLLLSATARQEVEKIDAALARMDAGTFGVCTPAGRPITLARLEAIPWAETCVECAQRVARRR
jgi:RNA polymerase-binding protein DksA